MENQLVEVRGKKIFTTSLIVAEKFAKKHAYVKRVIGNLIIDFSRFQGDSKSPWFLSKKGKYQGQEFDFYEMTTKHLY